MSDVSKTNELIEETRRWANGHPNRRASELIHGLLDALESATRFPVQGEPNDDREALIEIIRSTEEQSTFARQHAAIADNVIRFWSRATVPDAATETLRAERDTLGRAAFAAVLASGEDTDGATDWKGYFGPLRHPAWVDAVHQNVTSLAEERDEAQADEFRERTRAEKAEAERDAALAAIAAVRAIHYDAGMSQGYGAQFKGGYGEIENCCATCGSFGEFGVAYPCPTIAALDGAPEPERKKQLERVAARLREVVYLCGDDLGCQCEEAHDASADLARELSIIAAERPTLTADEVWAIAKAEHDYANDSDNVGAFVDSLTDALRTAGVAFDEQPFIDSGYLLPVEGESNDA